MLAPSPCLDCPDLAVKRGRCAAHQIAPWFGSTRKARLPADWSTRRLIVLNRDHGICWICGQPGADEVDHKVPNDDDNLANLAPIHQNIAPHCHRAKSSAEGNAARRGNRARPRH
ncbi:5-methylcytosine-specific restriction enzyme A [Nakamurella panacisegetis]|uniref:5-methylcytosine-specific restriction enzyme A n=1 Tax=Nakamurella panacisegetis TaxID=1090615 RepID=A0A1H0PXV2_9ACTN|nr:5-methylcytosine-specific restriction enzyme A [Nakamurella panacisegetis]